MNKSLFQEKGFTLIEQLLIVMIFSILLSIIGGKVPKILESAEAKKQVNLLKQDLQLASYTAFIKKTRVTVEFHPTNVSYQVIEQNSEQIIASNPHKKAPSSNPHFKKAFTLIKTDIQIAAVLSLFNLAVKYINSRFT